MKSSDTSGPSTSAFLRGRRAALGTASLFLLLVASVSCGADEPEAPPPAVDPLELDFDPSLGIDLDRMDRLASGLYIQDLYLGSGLPVRRGSSVSIHYTGWLPDGTRFDSTEGRQPFSMVVGETAVARGLMEGVIGIREGGRRKLVIPADLGYGEAGRPPHIPPQSTLIFNIEVLDVS